MRSISLRDHGRRARFGLAGQRVRIWHGTTGGTRESWLVRLLGVDGPPDRECPGRGEGVHRACGGWAAPAFSGYLGGRTTARGGCGASPAGRLRWRLCGRVESLEAPGRRRE